MLDGGCVAQAFAAAHPHRVEGLLLVDTTDWYGPDAPATWRERAAVARRDGLAGMAAFQTTRWFGDDFREAYPETVQAAMTGVLQPTISAATRPPASCSAMPIFGAGWRTPASRSRSWWAKRIMRRPSPRPRGLPPVAPGASVTVLKGHVT